MASLLLMGLRTVLSKFNNNEKDVSVKTNVARRGTLLEKHSGGTRIHFFPLRTIMEPDMTFFGWYQDDTDRTEPDFPTCKL